jgi:hypothetical protein
LDPKRPDPFLPEILKHFRYEHLPPKLQAVSKPFCDLARAVCGVSSAMPEGTSVEFPLPAGEERDAGLRKLLEAKDCFVRAALEPEGTRKL